MTNTALIPTERLELDSYDWYERHAAKCREMAERSCDAIFIGDSITHFFEYSATRPEAGRVWQHYYGHRRVGNLGFGWDRTQNVLWRLAHGEWGAQRPRLAVLNIGTNNLTGTENARVNTAAEIVAAVQEICAWIRRAAPDTVIVQMALLPRDLKGSTLFAQVRELNALFATVVPTLPGCRHLNIASEFLTAQGELNESLYLDRCHPTEAGYERWAAALEPWFQAAGL